jgi:hypothetical protein
MRATYNSTIDYASALCTACGVPLDSQYFDESSVVCAPKVGEAVVLAEFGLPPQYCGILEYFAQFTDKYERDNSLIETPGIEWLILADGGPLFPYLTLKHIVNPWGNGAFPVAIRLPENTTLRFIARGVSPVSTTERFDRRESDTGPSKIGGRLLGRFWFNAAHGDAAQRRF